MSHKKLTRQEIRIKFYKFPIKVESVPKLAKAGYLPETAKWMAEAECDFRSQCTWLRAYNELDYMSPLDLYSLPNL